MVVAGVVVLAAVAAGTAMWARDDQPASGLTVAWGDGEGQPGCVYDPESDTVEALITVEGTAPEPDMLTVTVTAYADENTSEPVGSGTSSAEVDGTVGLPLVITIPVEQAPHVGEDGVAACAIAVEYAHPYTLK